MFTKELNKLAHKIKKAHSLTWGEALKLAIALPEENLMASTSLLGDWTYETARAVAGHFYGIAKTYEEVRDSGRAFYFRRLANKIYAALDAGYTYSFSALLIKNSVKDSAVQETIDFYLAAYKAKPTARQLKLVRNSQRYASLAKLPVWFF